MPIHRKLLALGLSVLGVAAATYAQQPQSAAQTPGLVSGRVIDLGSGKPVAEAMVTVQVGIEPAASDVRVLTDSEGRFVFVNVPAGRYTLQAYKLGYLPGELGQRIYQGDRKKLDVTAGQIVTDLTVPVWKWAALGGKVIDEAGQPIVGVRVMAYRRAVSMGATQLEAYNPANARAITDDRGVFRITALPPGEFAVGVPVNTATLSAEFMSIMNSSAMPTIPVQAYAAVAELGPLGDARNQQVGSSVVMGESRSVIPPAPTADAMPMVYRTTFSPATTKANDAAIAVLNAGEERSDLDIVMRPVRAVRVSGQLIGPDGPIPQLSIRLFAVGEYQTSSSPVNSHTAATLTDASGRFTMFGVPEGDYIASALLSSPTEWITIPNEPFHVGSADISDLTLTARRATRVYGKFDLHGAKPPAALNTLWVLLDITPFAYTTMGLVPKEDLTFDTRMPAGRYLPFFGAPQGLSCSTVLQGGRDMSDAVIVGSEPLELIVHCSESPNRVTGTVRKEDGSRDSDAMIVAFPADRQLWTGESYSPRRFKSTSSDSTGAFTMLNLPAGDFFVAAIPIDKSNLWQDAKRLDLISRSATRVSMTPTDVRSVELRTVVIR